ncbi:alpha/beta hydrolase [Terrisporobacter sp.]|uniref:alpha/beta hydrolase n=1 Tax=Terrisporobacter sp. TaxID=1965305 RepID=UPI0026097AFD|nr:alpha/beta hydrolase [Terrisporobacter sp.]
MILKHIIFIILIFTLFLFYISYRLYNYGLNPYFSKGGIFSNKKNENVPYKDIWLSEYKYKKDIYINSDDNLKLHGYLVPNNNSHKWVIAVHGYMCNSYSVSNIAYRYFNMGYNMIIPDLRGHGKSEGSYIGMGWHDRLDILGWIRYIIKKDQDAEIILHGVSMGTSTVMMVSGEDVPLNVKAIIEDCGYTSAKDQFSYKIKNMYKIPSFPVLNICSLISKLKANYFIEEASSIKQIKKSKIPILFIHGDKDKFVPFYMHNELYEACNSKKEKLIIENAGHAKCEKVNSQLYWERVEKFIIENTR